MWFLKTEKSKRGKNERRRSCSQVKKHSSDFFTVAVKSSGDISADPVSRQKIEEHVVTDLDLRNDENRPCFPSSAVAEERQDLQLINTLDEMADAITGGNDIALGPLANQHTGNNVGILVEI